MMKILLAIVLAGIAVSAASYMTGHVILGGSTDDVAVSMSIITDTETYHSGEFMEATVTIATGTDITSGIIRLYGIENGMGDYEVDEEIPAEINSPGSETSFLVRMPRCYGCAGVSPGEYELTSELLYGNEIVGSCSKTITLAG